MLYPLRRNLAPFAATSASQTGTWNWLYRRSILIAALVTASSQVFFLSVPFFSHSSALLSNIAQILLGIFSILAILEAARAADRFSRRVWLRAGLAIAFYSTGQTILTYGMAFHSQPDLLYFTDIFFFWMLPLLAASVIDYPEMPTGFDWASVLDFAQLVLFAVALHLFVFGDAARWHTHAEPIGFLKWKMRGLRDLVVLVCLFCRAYISNREQIRSLFLRLGTFYLIYTVADLVYLYSEASRHVLPGTAMDLWWSAPRLALVMLALRWKRDIPAASNAAIPAYYWRPRCMLLYWAPVSVPLVLVGLGASSRSTAPKQWATLLAISFAVAGMRLLITQFRQEQALEQLHASNNLLHSVIEGSSDAIYLKDADGRYSLINSAGAGFLGLRSEDVIGKTDADLFASEAVEFIRAADQEMRRAGRPIIVEETLQTPGMKRTFLSTKTPYRDAHGREGGVLGLSVDITQRRTMEEQLRRAQRMESLGTFSGGIAHDFNNLLTVIKGYSQLTLADPQSMPAEMREFMEQIDRASGRAAALISQLLAFSRQQVLKPRVISLNQIVSGIEPLLARLIGADVQIETHLAPDLAAIQADPGQIEQILMNLAANARDAMPSGGTLVVQTSNLVLKEDLPNPSFVVPAGHYVLLRVSDNGTGMDAQTQARIFEPFFTTKPQGKGTGLGLATVYGIVKQSGGYIGVESSPEIGTTFRVYLPQVFKPFESTALVKPREVVRRAGRTVLVVDDDEQVRGLAATILARAGFTVLQASSPLEAERIAAAHPGAIDLLLADVVMPSGGGREAARRIQASGRKPSVLFMSGHPGDAVMHRGFSDSSHSFLPKPFSPDVFLERVNEVLARRPRKAILERV